MHIPLVDDFPPTSDGADGRGVQTLKSLEHHEVRLGRRAVEVECGTRSETLDLTRVVLRSTALMHVGACSQE